MTTRGARWWWLAAGVALTAWIVTAFMLALPTGWVHGLLVVGVLAIVRGIVEQDGVKGGHGRSQADTGGRN
jgi:hypothetical protein